MVYLKGREKEIKRERGIEKMSAPSCWSSRAGSWEAGIQSRSPTSWAEGGDDLILTPPHLQWEDGVGLETVKTSCFCGFYVFEPEFYLLGEMPTSWGKFFS